MIVKYLLSSILFLLLLAVRAQDGSLDPLFGDSGTRVISLENRNTRGDVMEYLDDGSIILGVNSDTTKFGGWFDVCFYIYKLQPNGQADTTFGNGGSLYYPQGSGGHSMVFAMAQPDKNTVVVSCVVNGALKILKFNPDGQKDTLFNVPGFSNYSDKRYIGVQSDQKLVVSGSYPAGSFSKLSIYRVNPDGTPDLSFGNNGLLNFNPTQYRHIICGEMMLQDDNKIIVVGSAYDSETHRNALIMRFNPDGSMDSTFNNSGISYPQLGSQQYAGHFYDLAILPNGQIMVTGIVEYPGGTGGWYANHPLAVKFNADGTLDSTFGTAGVAILYTLYNANDITETVAVQADGKVLLGGRASHPYPVMQSDFYITRLKADGQVDGSFGTNGYFLSNFNGIETNVVRDLCIQSDNKILAYGLTKDETNSYFHAVICRLQNDSSLSLTTRPAEEVIIYPNPVNSLLHVKAKGIDRLEIYNIAGKLIHSQSSLYSKNEVSIATDALKPGMYFLILHSEHNFTSQAFIKD